MPCPTCKMSNQAIRMNMQNGLHPQHFHFRSPREAVAVIRLAELAVAAPVAPVAPVAPWRAAMAPVAPAAAVVVLDEGGQDAIPPGVYAQPLQLHAAGVWVAPAGAPAAPAPADLADVAPAAPAALAPADADEAPVDDVLEWHLEQLENLPDDESGETEDEERSDSMADGEPMPDWEEIPEVPDAPDDEEMPEVPGDEEMESDSDNQQVPGDEGMESDSSDNQQDLIALADRVQERRLKGKGAGKKGKGKGKKGDGSILAALGVPNAAVAAVAPKARPAKAAVAKAKAANARAKAAVASAKAAVEAAGLLMDAAVPPARPAVAPAQAAVLPPKSAVPPAKAAVAPASAAPAAPYSEAFASNFPMPSEPTLFCSLCNGEVEMSKARLRSKLKQIWHCNECNSTMTKVYRNPKGPIDFTKCDQAEINKFFQECKGKHQNEINLLSHDLISTYKHEETYWDEGGEFLPLSVWTTRGFDADRIEALSQPGDVRQHAVLGKTYRVSILAAGNKGAQGRSQSSNHDARPASSSNDGLPAEKRLRVDMDQAPNEDMAQMEARVKAALSASLVVSNGNSV